VDVLNPAGDDADLYPGSMPRPLAIVLAVAGIVAALLAGCGGGGSTTGGGAGAVPLHPVAGGFKPNDVSLQDCPSADEPDRCREQAYGNLAYREGPKVALHRLVADMAAQTEVERGCHRIVHMIGSATLARDKGNVGQAFTEGDSTCWSGYYHGILERALVDAGNDVLLSATVRGICADVLRDESRFISYQCVHGLGHGLMILTGLDLPRSLKQCEGLRTQWEQVSCDGGVFMENFNTSYGVTSRYLRDDDLLYPCDAVKERHKLYCYLQITDRLLSATGYDWPQTAKLCAGAESAWRATCFQSFGRSASGTARLDQGALVRTCEVPAAHWRSDCVYGAVRDIASNDAGGKRAIAFCGAVERRLRARCYYGAGTILAGIETTAAGLAKACAPVPARYGPECRQERVVS
jgi:hypothetical protein